MVTCSPDPPVDAVKIPQESQIIMFFKRIEIVGFKSFASRTICDFLPGTTIVVGPNGCGKSNILDAIKWVLGEQGAKQLRGKKMQDVIFSGSASFKPLGVAEVRLTVDNRKRILPMDFNEIQVTRRLFRTGESEYQINKIPCRLRDVHNLFMGTGMGKSSYSMIEQGRIGLIINSKPIERRYLFEEAAGISKYKARKLEALRKLERTEIDLSRLRDLLLEVERQVNSLKRQAGKARRYRELIGEYEKGEQELMLIRFNGIHDQLNEISSELSGVRGQLGGMRETLSSRNAALNEARDKSEELNNQVQEGSQTLFDLQNNITNCQHQVQRLADRIQGRDERKGQISREIEELLLRKDEISLRLDDNRQRHERFERSLQKNRELFEDHDRNYQVLRESTQTRTRSIDELGVKIVSLRLSISEAENEVRSAEAQLARMDGTRHQAEEQIRALETSVHDFDEQHAQLKSDSDMQAEQLAKLTKEEETLQAGLGGKREDLLARHEELESTTRELSAGRTRLETLQELASGYEGFYQGVREVMQESDRRKLKGIHGVVANLIEAGADHELAIEVALGSRLQNVITDKAEQAREAIMYLKKEGRGRATFLPLDRLKIQEPASTLREVIGKPGVVGFASDMVKYDPPIDKAVQFLLGTTILVEDLDIALKLSREGYHGRYVSLDGQLINPSGSMTGGRVKSSGLMTREREIRDLEKKNIKLDKQTVQMRKHIDKLTQETKKLEQKLTSRKADLETYRMEYHHALKDIEMVARQLDESRGQLEQRSEQVARIEADGIAHLAIVEEMTGRAGVSRVELEKLEEGLQKERDEARNQSEDIVELGTMVAEAQAAMARSREAIAEGEREQNELQQDLDAYTLKNEQRQVEQQGLDEEKCRLEDKIRQIQEEIDKVGSQREEVNLRLNHDQAERDKVVVRIRELSSEIEALERDEKQLDNRLRESEMRQIELRTRSNELNEQCVSKYDMDLENMAAKLGTIESDPAELQKSVTEMRMKLDRIGIVNMGALEEYEEQAARLGFLREQDKDLTAAASQLKDTIARLDEMTRQLFHETFEEVRKHFVEMFRRLFNGGKADLVLETPEGLDPLLDGGVEIVAQPPGKKLQNITLMSGGEKAMTAIALLFGLFLHKPSPFCILDEVDAPLDDVNVERFKDVLEEFKKDTQFLVITHNKLTMELADALYGITMEESGVSKLVSVRFGQAEKIVAV
jgi:chromosome segregation protein